MRHQKYVLFVAAALCAGCDAHPDDGAHPQPVRPVRPLSAKQFPEIALQDYTAVPVWPLPASGNVVGGFTLSPANFRVMLQPQGDPFLVAVARELTANVFPLPVGTPIQPKGSLTTLYIQVSNASIRYVNEGVDESYSLTFSSDLSTATISAATIFGARHGAESFSQLTGGDRATGHYTGLAVNITDVPRFPYRGLLIDTTRQWYTPNTLLSLFDAMGYVKLNTLQVLFSMDWSWTIESKAFPNLTDASYSPSGTHWYSQQTVRWLIEQANQRGIRIIPYFEVIYDEPIHYVMPELFWCRGKQGSGLPHPLHQATWDFFDALWADMRMVFVDDYLNFGGNIFDTSCWQNDSEITAWMHENGYDSLNYVVALFYERMIRSLGDAGFRPILFGEAFRFLNGTGVNLSGTDIIFDFSNQGTPGSAAAAIQASGVRVIVSGTCFLTPLNSCPDLAPGGQVPTWEYNYGCELQNSTLFPPQALPYLGNIIGGHATRGDISVDSGNLLQSMFPAVLGVAEKLWTPAAITNNASVMHTGRANAFPGLRCTLIERGLYVPPACAYCWSCSFESEMPYPRVTPQNPNPTNSSWVWNYNNGASASIMDSSVDNCACSAMEAEIATLRDEVAQLRAALAAQHRGE